MTGWLKQPELQHLAASIGVWLRRVLLPPMATDAEWSEIGDFSELTDMLQERVRRWPERWKQEGRQEGRLEMLLHHRRGLVRLTQKRFGPDVAMLASDRLEAIADPQRLEELTDAFLDCVNGEQWLDRIGRPLN